MNKIIFSKDGFLNRKENPLPNTPISIEIIINDVMGEEIIPCMWHPFNPDEYSQSDMPYEGYLGTARTKTIGFHAWQQNNSEFIYYKIV